MHKAAFIFDLDGVITDTAIYHYHAWKRLAESLGIPFTEEDNEELKGVDRRGSLEFILAKSTASFSEAEKLRLMDQKNEDYKQLISDMTAKDILPGADRLLKELRERGHLTGLASASKNAMTVIEALGIADLFDYVADAALIPNSKPAPDVFLDVMKHFNLTPQDCIGIEDAAAGVQAIKSAGMFAVGIGNPGVLSQADMVVPAIQDVVIDKVLNAWSGTKHHAA